MAFLFLLAKRTLAIWDQLSEAEQALVDLNMEALMYSSTFTTKDEVAGYLGMNGDTDVNRDWNPNHQNGMVGMIILTALYGDLISSNLSLRVTVTLTLCRHYAQTILKNLLSTYTNPARPQAAKIQAGLRKKVGGAVYRFHGITDRNLLGLFNYIASRTFSGKISCGLNEGTGIGGYGRVVKDCEMLPNVGRTGMILEFDGWDAKGRRSSFLIVGTPGIR